MDSEGHCCTAVTGYDADACRAPSTVHHNLRLLLSDDVPLRVQAAKEIRRLTKTSQRCRRHFSAAVRPLVDMLRSGSVESNEAALLALLNLAVKDETCQTQHDLETIARDFLTIPTQNSTLQFPYSSPPSELTFPSLFSSLCHNFSRNKISIVDAGALEPIICFLRSENSNLQEHATASLLTLSASTVNKPDISASGAIPLLVKILRHGSPQAKVDAVMALYNLSTYSDNLSLILQAEPIPSIVNLLKAHKKSSKTAEKCSALLESFMGFEEGRSALTSEDGGVLAVVEVLESGSLQSREHAVGTLLMMCQSDRCKYREPILREGVIPGLLELTVQGTPKSQSKAQLLLRLLRDSPYPRSDFQPDTLENIVCNIISQIDGEDQCGKAKQMLAEMVQVSMEQSLRHLQQRALVCTPADLPIASEVSSK
ncbi:hypothetical protein RJ639_040729 [Escallonia herrerae]|uniref:U-box domain-containing protein n=1 Tax=Escallonia herrerae TaxID=1293975 RepID=A0AA88WKE2_9ASTE|nr:hypothetical protein RJ639_040729 [Escallonia herrerae]